MALIRPSSYWRDVSPRGAVADLVTVFRQAGENRWRIGIMSAVCTVAVFSVMIQEGGRGAPRPPSITYITSFRPDRSNAEIVASNIANQKRKERLAADLAKREEEVRNIYRTIGKYSGMDVETIEKQAAADRAVEARATAAEARHRAIIAGE
jgi:hypothetical protein